MAHLWCVAFVLLAPMPWPLLAVQRMIGPGKTPLVPPVPLLLVSREFFLRDEPDRMRAGADLLGCEHAVMNLHPQTVRAFQAQPFGHFL